MRALQGLTWKIEKRKGAELKALKQVIAQLESPDFVLLDVWIKNSKEAPYLDITFVETRTRALHKIKRVLPKASTPEQGRGLFAKAFSKKSSDVEKDWVILRTHDPDLLFKEEEPVEEKPKVKAFYLDGFGTWNCDVRGRMKEPADLLVRIEDIETNKRLKVDKIYLIDLTNQSTLSFKKASIFFDNGAENLLIVQERNGHVGVIRPGQLKRMAKKKRKPFEVQFTSDTELFTSWVKPYTDG